MNDRKKNNLLSKINLLDYLKTDKLSSKQKTGIKEFAWHKCRHTYAKNMLRNDVDLETLRQMLGHEDLQTTGIYAELDTGEALESVMKKNVKFYREGEGFKSSKPWYISDGPVGI